MSEAKKLCLFYVHSVPGRKIEGEFSSKVAAKKFRDKHNANLAKGEHPWFVGVGHDHWRWKTDLTVPQRPIIVYPQAPEFAEVNLVALDEAA